MVERVTPLERARRLIDENDNMTVATADASGVPWVSPVFYAPDSEHNLYWVSAKRARHSENIRTNEHVGIVIFETRPATDAVYVSGAAVELNDPDDVATGMAVMAGKQQPERWQIDSVADVTGGGPWRIYRATPKTIEVRLERMEDHKAIVDREPADFRQSHE